MQKILLSVPFSVELLALSEYIDEESLDRLFELGMDVEVIVIKYY